jgi:hypothetical protein
MSQIKHYGRVNHRPDEATHQKKCLARYITQLPRLRRTDFVEGLERRHGVEFVNELRRLCA